MNGQEFHLCRILPFQQSISHHCHYRKRPIFPLSGWQDGRRGSEFCGMESRPIEEILDWQIVVLLSSTCMRMTFCSLTRENQAQKLSFGVEKWRLLCDNVHVALANQNLSTMSPRMQHANSTVAFEMNEGAWIVKRPYRVIQVTITIMYLTWTYVQHNKIRSMCIAPTLSQRSEPISGCMFQI